jgi:hypothetical protein
LVATVSTRGCIKVARITVAARAKVNAILELEESQAGK